MALKVFEEVESNIETFLDANDKTKLHQIDVGRYIESSKINQVTSNIPPEDPNYLFIKQRFVFNSKKAYLNQNEIPFHNLGEYD